MKKVCFTAMMLAGSIASASAMDLRSEGFKKMSGPQIKAAFAGHEFADDVHFAFRYTADGFIQGMGMGSKVARRWRVQKDEICETDANGEECFAVWRKGPVVRFVLGDDMVFAEGQLK